jgi:chorismate synthase
MSEGRVATATNNSGGVNGGISNGMPIVFEAAIRPTPSIGMEQDTVDLRTMTDTKLTVKGRHDPCIVPRAVPVIEAAAALTLVDIMQRG